MPEENWSHPWKVDSQKCRDLWDRYL